MLDRRICLGTGSGFLYPVGQDHRQDDAETDLDSFRGRIGGFCHFNDLLRHGSHHLSAESHEKRGYPGHGHRHFMHGFHRFF